ncbi:hypothetical protein K440DRAFT_418164 [Wilcoxina mikolae CBS 423.85]|nr:hypothetical protein K440DRAFT_418164 [Wilcoxina mikolae CBS 423.85]
MMMLVWVGFWRFVVAWGCSLHSVLLFIYTRYDLVNTIAFILSSCTIFCAPPLLQNPKIIVTPPKRRGPIPKACKKKKEYTQRRPQPPKEKKTSQVANISSRAINKAIPLLPFPHHTAARNLSFVGRYRYPPLSRKLIKHPSNTIPTPLHKLWSTIMTHPIPATPTPIHPTEPMRLLAVLAAGIGPHPRD